MPVCILGSWWWACCGVLGPAGWIAAGTVGTGDKESEFLTMLFSRGCQVRLALLDLKENLGLWGPLDR